MKRLVFPLLLVFCNNAIAETNETETPEVAQPVQCEFQGIMGRNAQSQVVSACRLELKPRLDNDILFFAEFVTVFGQNETPLLTDVRVGHIENSEVSPLNIALREVPNSSPASNLEHLLPKCTAVGNFKAPYTSYNLRQRFCVVKLDQQVYVFVVVSSNDAPNALFGIARFDDNAFTDVGLNTIP